MAFPVKSAQTQASICGVATDFHVSVYADRVLVIITQNGWYPPYFFRARDQTVDRNCSYSYINCSCLSLLLTRGPARTGKPGTLLLAQRERGAGGIGGGVGSFTTKVLMGKRDDYMQVYARRVAEMVAAKCEKPLLLTLCIKDDSPEVFKAVIATLATVAIW
jgi:hypothetical protein